MNFSKTVTIACPILARFLRNFQVLRNVHDTSIFSTWLVLLNGCRSYGGFNSVGAFLQSFNELT